MVGLGDGGGDVGGSCVSSSECDFAG